jgi:hypothetical protein
VVWIYGTIQDGHARVPAAAWAALESADYFVSELGENRPSAESLRQEMLLPGDERLDTQLPAEDWEDLRDALRGVAPEDVLRRARPWFAASLLKAAKAPSSWPSMERALARRARELRIPIEALGDEWRPPPRASEIAIPDLQREIRARHSLRCRADRALAAYEAGDLEAMGQLLVAGSRSDFALSAGGWKIAVLRYLASGDAFIAVRIGYMVGPRNLLAELQRDGFIVERVPPRGTLGPRTYRADARLP